MPRADISTATYHIKKEYKRCEAKAKQSGKRCQRPVIAGRNVCYWHGGKGGRPIIHGADSKELPMLTERQRVAQLQASEQLLDMKPIIATMKARLEASETIPDNTELFSLFDTMSKVIERHEKLQIMAKAGIPKEQVKIFINRLIYILTNAGLEAKTLEAIGREINKAATETMPI